MSNAIDREGNLSPLEKLEYVERLISDVMKGETRYCEVCSKELYYVEPGSGKYPGVYCETGCTSIEVNTQKS